MSELLLDTCVLYWALCEPTKLSQRARAALEAAESGGRWYISGITLVEFQYLVERGRLPREVWDRSLALLRDHGVLRVWSVDEDIAIHLGQIPRDQVPDMPDRIIAATALAYSLPLVTSDSKIRSVSTLTIIW